MLRAMARRREPKSTLQKAAARLREATASLAFPAPVTHVYHPLQYAWPVHETYLGRYGAGRRKIIFLGMNPGPFGMAQTGIPFGEVAMVRDWLKLEGDIGRPADAHPKRPVDGWNCQRSEVSGRRLWGLFAERFQTAPAFFKHHFVVNYCPLLFLEAEGKSCRNLTPDKLGRETTRRLFDICDRHLREVCAILEPDWVVGVGKFAEGRAREALSDFDVRIGSLLHPSPASPAANRDWAGRAQSELSAQGIWPDAS